MYNKGADLDIMKRGKSIKKKGADPGYNLLIFIKKQNKTKS